MYNLRSSVACAFLRAWPGVLIIYLGDLILSAATNTLRRSDG
jgi:hypothetical protein